VNSKLETELLKAGCPADRLSKAVKLFDASKIGFNWTNEEALEYDIEDFGAELESFQKDNDFLFGTVEGDEPPPSGYQGKRAPNAGSKSVKEKTREGFIKKYPQIFNS
jgi:hypothetical protein